MQRIRMQLEVNARPEIVFSYLGDHEQFGRIWRPAVTKRVVDGTVDNQVNGQGSIRKIQLGPLAWQESHVVYERPERIDYQIIHSPLIKQHHGSIRLKALGNGKTKVIYDIRFDTSVPLMGSVIKSLIQRLWKNGIPKLIAEMEAEEIGCELPAAAKGIEP